MYQEYLIYWIHSDQETNIEAQGYVGITKNLTRRLKEHRRKHNFLDNRKVDVFLYGDKLYCKQIEKSLRPRRNIGLNIAEGGGLPPNVKGIKRSDQTRQKIKDSMVGFKGRKHSEETKTKMRAVKRTLHLHTEETKKRLSEIAKNRTTPNSMLGKKHSPEAIEKIRAKAKARWANNQAEELKKFVDAA
jgi:hypothetical protein